MRGGHVVGALSGLALWCGSGALVGATIGTLRGRLAAGVLLGTFCGVLGWILVLGAPPRRRTPRVMPAAAVAVPATVSATVTEADVREASAPAPLAWRPDAPAAAAG
jgi:hypothetical protein